MHLLLLLIFGALSGAAYAIEISSVRLTEVEKAVPFEGPNCMSTTLFLAGVLDHVANLGEPYFLATFANGGFAKACRDVLDGEQFQAGDVLILKGRQVTGERERSDFPHVGVFVDDYTVASKENWLKGGKILKANARDIAHFWRNCLPGEDNPVCKYRALVSRCDHREIRRQYTAWAKSKEMDVDFAVVDEFFRAYYLEHRRDGLKSAEAAMRRLEKKKLFGGVMYDRYINNSLFDLFNPSIPPGKVGEFLLFLRVEGSREALDSITREIRGQGRR